MDDLDTKAVDFVYDPAGKIQQVNDPTGTYAFAYDNSPATTASVQATWVV